MTQQHGKKEENDERFMPDAEEIKKELVKAKSIVDFCSLFTKYTFKEEVIYGPSILMKQPKRYQVHYFTNMYQP